MLGALLHLPWKEVPGAEALACSSGIDLASLESAVEVTYRALALASSAVNLSNSHYKSVGSFTVALFDFFIYDYTLRCLSLHAQGTSPSLSYTVGVLKSVRAALNQTEISFDASIPLKWVQRNLAELAGQSPPPESPSEDASNPIRQLTWPSLDESTSLHPFATIKLTKHFFSELISTYRCSCHDDKDSGIASHVIEAFVSSVQHCHHRHHITPIEWETYLSLYPAPLKLLIQSVFSVVAFQAKDTWPGEILRWIHREDLIGNNNIYSQCYSFLFCHICLCSNHAD